jgi:D-alanyl-D-alanine carboxypeptidase/D-alanyl-D-alanine-endopeptidase (penicillin-binding protein 4)
VGRQDSHNGPVYGGVSGQAENAPGGNAASGRASVPMPPSGSSGTARVPSPGAVYGTPTGANNTISPGYVTPAPPPARFPAAPPSAPPSAPPEGGPRGRRTALISALSVFVLLVVAAAALLVVRPGPVRGWLADGPAPTSAPPVDPPEPAPPAVLAAATGDVATAQGVRSALAALVKNPVLGTSTNISVVDVTTGEELYSANPDAMTVPASTTKLVTAAAVLAARGPAYRLTTRVVAGAEPGEVVIVGGGDPTLGSTANRLFPGGARLDRLAAQVKKALGGTAPTRVVIDGSLFSGPELGPGWDSDLVFPGGQAARVTALSINAGRVKPVHNLVGADPRFADPSKGAGKAFAKALGIPAAPVVNGKAPEAAAAADPAATAIAPGTELGRVDSPPMIRLVDWMLQLSDNVLAEALARQVALAKGEPASFEGAETAVESAITELGLPAEESRLRDGSGLSRQNEVSPSLLTDLLKLAAGGTRPELVGMFDGLPVAGWSGTLQDRFQVPKVSRPGLGVVRAKTGTLSGVSALSGEVVTVDGRLLVFALMADGVSDGSRDAARVALDAIAAKLATCGCP